MISIEGFNFDVNMRMGDKTIDETVDDILTQLAENKKNCTDVAKSKEYDKVTKDKLEDFVIEKSADLVQRALEIVDDIKDRATAGGDADEVRALAEVLKATSQAVESLNKIHISSERNKTAKEINQNTLEAKKGMNTQNNQTRLMMSREEAMKQLFDKVRDRDDSRVIDIEVIEDQSNMIGGNTSESSGSSNEGNTPGVSGAGSRLPDSKLGNPGSGLPEESVGTESPDPGVGNEVDTVPGS